MKTLRIVPLTLILLCLAATAFSAQDPYPPDWRGLPGTTFQLWSFDTDANPASPNLVSNPNGEPEANITVGEYGSGWSDQLPGMGSRTGYWHLGDGSIWLDIPNGPVSDPYNLVRVQVTYFEDISQAPNVYIAGADLAGWGTSLIEHVDTGGDWYLGWTDWALWPNANPNLNVISITADSMGGVVDQVVVDTRYTPEAVPEPGTLAALATLLGPAAMVFRRRRA